MPTIRIGIIGDYDARPSHLATEEAISHCALCLSLCVESVWLPTKSLLGKTDDLLSGFSALFCAPGSPYESFEGATNAIRYAREHRIPFLGTCGGFQHCVMEYAINVLGYTDAHHEELEPNADSFVISALSCSLVGQMGNVLLKKDSLCGQIYGKDAVMERFNCNYGLNGRLIDALEKSGLEVAGVDENLEVRILELPKNGFYIATLYQPQLSSTPENPHKLILAYLRAAREHHDSIGRSTEAGM